MTDRYDNMTFEQLLQECKQRGLIEGGNVNGKRNSGIIRR